MSNDFIFHSYHFDENSGQLSLCYQYADYHFEEKLFFPNAPFKLSDAQNKALDKVLFLLHIAAGVSYYKAFGNPTIQVASGVLTKSQAAFFDDFYYYGLAQFAATNNLKLSFSFPFDENIKQEAYPILLDNQIFVPVGGGKNSCVTMTLLKEQGYTPTTFSVNTARAIEECKHISGLQDITVTRKISPLLLEKNPTFLNGHVPITGIIAFILLVCAVLYDKRYVAMSCESSADEGNFGDVNHQWSKSTAFEKSFYALTQEILPDFCYFSLLRPLTEIHIAKLFALKCKPYFDVFTSCNHAFHIDESKRLLRWCGCCDKCRFVFLALAPYMNKQKLIEIVGTNPLDDPQQLEGYEQLLGLSGYKPFECVGTIAESQCAFGLLKNLTEWKNDFVINKLYDKIQLNSDELKRLMTLQSSPMIPKEFLKCLQVNES